MCAPFQMHSCDCRGLCGSGEILTIDEEIRKMEVMRQHLQFQLELIERRIASLKKVGK
ncbi:MAG: hypothetical protein LUQ67_06995 [Methanomicrobiales archaeon]|nr:hypothetical protein [Methanomicrobiales archaeon]